jgi:EamA domain-containing membrane protein RarD
LRFAVAAALSLGVLPLLFALVPDIAEISIFGMRLPWLILGVLVYPFLLGLGWWHTRTAERVEQNFADHVQD